MDRFELPAEITSLDNDALDALLEQAVTTFDTGSSAESITQEDLAALRKLTEDIRTIRAEKTARTVAAEEAVSELATMAAEVRGEAPGEAEDPPAEDPPAEADPEADPAEVDPAESEPTEAVLVAEGETVVAEGELVTAAATPNRHMNLAEVRARQPKQKLPAKPKDRVEIRAAADVPGLGIGQGLDIDQLVDGVINRANGLKSAGRPAQAMVASYMLPFPEDLQVTDAQSAAMGTSVVLAAADQGRLPGGDLVASGGWCAPSETIYDIADVACPDMLWSAPEVQLKRGGLRYYKTPTLDISGLTWIHTEANDIAGATKPIFRVPCPDPFDRRCEAIGVIIEAGILTERFFPELVAWYVRNSMVAHEIRVSQAMFLGAIAASTHVVMGETMGAFTAVFGAVALQAADLVEKHSLCESTGVEVVFPWWSKNLFLADIARQNAREFDEIDPNIIAKAFATLGVSVQWARGLPPGVPTDIGAAAPAPSWPDDLNFLIHPAGAFQIGRGAEVNLGAVYDSNTFVTNDYTALFTEECVALIDRGPESRFVTVPICPDGTTGSQAIAGTTLECPIDAASVVS